MRVLFITYYFPPDPAVGAIRAQAIVDAARRAGHDVTVITNRIDGASETSDVLRVRTLPNPREMFLSLRAWFRRSKRVRGGDEPGNGEGPERRAGYRPPDHVPSWKRFLVAMALMPDDYHGFIWPAIARAMPIIRRGTQVIYTSGPPHSVHLTGLILRKLTGVPWIAEFRDPWLDNANQPRYARSRTADRIRASLERRCLEGADLIVSATAGAAKMLAGKTGRTDIVVARTGMAEATLENALPARSERASGERRILYMGNLYHQRDPRPLFRAIAELRRRSELPPDGVRIDLYGDCAWFHDVSVSEAAREAGIGDLVFIHGRVPLDEARRITHAADLLLLLAWNQPVQVPQKLYEYLAVRRPIIAFADTGSETAEILAGLGSHFVVHKPEDAVPVLRQALERNDFQEPDAAAFQALASNRQMDALVRRLEQLVADRKTRMVRRSDAPATS